MSIAELKAEVDRLSTEDRLQLLNYLRPKILPMDAKTRRLLAEKINDNDPAHWVTLEELEKRLELTDEPQAP